MAEVQRHMARLRGREEGATAMERSRDANQ